MKIGVVTFPGSLDDADAGRAVTTGGHEAVALWHADADLRGVDAVVLPGGFSYGDYLRCGAISRFAPVMAVRETAVIDQRPELREALREVPRVEIPDADLTEAGGVDDIATRREGDHRRGGRGVAPAADLLRDGAHPQPEPGLDRVQQRGLPRPARSRHHRLRPDQPGRDGGQPRAEAGTRLEQRVAGGREMGADRIGRGEVDLVGDDQRRQVVRFGDDEQAVDQLQDRFRVGGRDDDHDLVDVGGDGSFPAALGGAPGEQGGARLHAVDPQDFLVKRGGIDPDPVAGDGAVTVPPRLAAQHPEPLDPVEEEAIAPSLAREDDGGGRAQATSPPVAAAIRSSRCAFTS